MNDWMDQLRKSAEKVESARRREAEREAKLRTEGTIVAAFFRDVVMPALEEFAEGVKSIGRSFELDSRSDTEASGLFSTNSPWRPNLRLRVRAYPYDGGTWHVFLQCERPPESAEERDTGEWRGMDRPTELYSVDRLPQVTKQKFLHDLTAFYLPYAESTY